MLILRLPKLKSFWAACWSCFRFDQRRLSDKKKISQSDLTTAPRIPKQPPLWNAQLPNRSSYHSCQASCPRLGYSEQGDDEVKTTVVKYSKKSLLKTTFTRPILPNSFTRFQTSFLFPLQFIWGAIWACSRRLVKPLRVPRLWLAMALPGSYRIPVDAFLNRNI